MIRVLHSELQSNIGGIESFLLNLTKTIDKTNLQFDFLMRGDNPYLENTLKNYGANIYKVPSGITNYHKFVKNILIKNNYDFVHVHKNSAANIVLPLMVKKYTNAKLIVHSHNTSPSGGSKIAIMLHKINRTKLMQLSDYRFACSDTAAEWMFGHNYKDEQVKIIKNGIIVKDYVYNPEIRNKVRTEMGLEDKFVIGHVGAFREQKNHKFLLKLFSQLNIPNAELVLVGKGPLKNEMKNYAEELNIQDRVLFLGSRNDVSDLLQAFDVFAMPSLWEGLGIAAIESQTSGLPTLVSTNFPSDVKITDQLHFLPLQDKLWIREVEKGKKKNRSNNNEIIKNAGYDMQISSEIIRNVYMGKMKYE